MRRPGTLLAIGLLLAAVTCAAQDTNRGRIEVSGGIRWVAAVKLANVAALESKPGGGTLALFESSTRLDRSVGGTTTLGVRLSRMLRAELAFAYNPTGVSSRVSSDTEGVADLTVGEPVTQLLLEGGILAQPRRWQSARVRPFMTSGVGYLRQLNDGRTFVQSGQSAYVGGGLYYVRATARPGRLKATGVRADVRARFLRGGVAPDHSVRVAPAVTATVFARF